MPKFKCDILSDFQTMWACAFRHLGKAAPPLKSKAKKEVKCKFPFHNCFYIVAPLEEGSLKSRGRPPLLTSKVRMNALRP